MKPNQLSENEIHIWFLDRTKTAIANTTLLSYLSASELSKYDEILNQTSKMEYLYTRATTRKVLSFYLEVSEAKINFRNTSKYRPILEPVPNQKYPLHFSISHSKDLICIAVFQQPEIGIDAEYRMRQSNLMQVAPEIMSEHELHRFFALPEPERREYFLRIWTLKESYLKALGFGLIDELQQISFSLKKTGYATLDSTHIECNGHLWSFQFPPLHSDYIVSLSYLKSAEVTHQIKIISATKFFSY